MTIKHPLLLYCFERWAGAAAKDFVNEWRVSTRWKSLIIQPPEISHNSKGAI